MTHPNSPFRILYSTLLITVGLVSCQANPTIETTRTATMVTRSSPTFTSSPVELPTFTLPAFSFVLPRATRTPIPPPPKNRTATVKTISVVRNAPFPAEFQITNISGHKQLFELGCEASAAVDWAGYFGVTIDENIFQTDIPISDNPDLGFVGDVQGTWGRVPPNDYGVHAAPVAELILQYGLPAHAYKQYTLDKIKLQLSKSQPVMAWVIGNVTGGTPIRYTDPSGQQTTVAAYEHVVIVTGYDENTHQIRYLNNGRFYTVSQEMFLASWGVLDNMVIVIEGPAQGQ